MALANMTLNVTSDLFSLCVVHCENYSCVYRNPDKDVCDLKYIKIGVDGKCETFKTVGGNNVQEQTEGIQRAGATEERGY